MFPFILVENSLIILNNVWANGSWIGRSKDDLKFHSFIKTFLIRPLCEFSSYFSMYRSHLLWRRLVKSSFCKNSTCSFSRHPSLCISHQFKSLYNFYIRTPLSNYAQSLLSSGPFLSNSVTHASSTPFKQNILLSETIDDFKYSCYNLDVYI